MEIGVKLMLSGKVKKVSLSRSNIRRVILQCKRGRVTSHPVLFTLERAN